MTQESVDSVLQGLTSSYDGQSVSYRGMYPSEAIAPVAQYIENLTGLVSATNLNSLPRAYFTCEAYQSGKAYPVGTILVWNNDHCAVVAAYRPDNTDVVRVFEQNADPDGSPCCVKDRVVNTAYYTCVTAILPLIKRQLPTPTHEQVIHMDETVDNVHYKSYGTPRKMFVRKLEGTNKIDFSGKISTFRDFVGVPNTAKKYNEPVRVMGLATYPIVPNGQTFYMDIDDWGEFTRTGRVRELRGYFENDLSPAEMPPKSRQVVPAVAWPKDAVVQAVKSPHIVTTEVIKAKPMTEIVPKVNIDYFRFQYLQDDQQPVRYQAMQPVIVTDYSCRGKRMSIIRGDKFGVFGTFRPYGDGRVRLLIKLQGTKLFDQWYGIPELSADGKRIVEVIPDYNQITTEAEAIKQEIQRDTKASHHVFHALSSIELFIKHDLFRIRR